jgi:hypothetical protein
MRKPIPTCRCTARRITRAVLLVLALASAVYLGFVAHQAFSSLGTLSQVLKP